MNRHIFLRPIGLLWLIALLRACDLQYLPWAPATPGPAVEGQVSSWCTDCPVEDRHIVLCRIVGRPEDGECLLQETAATTDSEGRFTMYGVSPGTYYVLYDSGLSDFDAALDRWGGQTLRFADPAWLSDYLGVDVEEDWVTFHLPQGLSFSPHEGWLCDYCRATLMMGNSPFLLAHDLKKVRDDHDVVHVLAQVPDNGIAHLEFQVVYFGPIL